MTTILLIDDERSFQDNREAVVVRNVTDAMNFIAGNPEVDELWLDYILGYEDISDVLFNLIDQKRKNSGVPVFTAAKVYYHSSSVSGYSLVKALCEDAGLPEPEHVDYRTVFVG